MTAIKHYTAFHKSILRDLAEQVCAAITLHQSVDQLVENPVLLHEYVSKIRINWSPIAQKLGQSRASIYHWYHETHLRHILGTKMSSNDKVLVKAVIADAIDSGDIYKKRFYMRIRDLFAEKYSRQEIMMQYNNLLRSKEIQKIMLSKHINFNGPRSKRRYTHKKVEGIPNTAICPCENNMCYNSIPTQACLPDQRHIPESRIPIASSSMGAIYPTDKITQTSCVQPPMTMIRCMSPPLLFQRNGNYDFSIPPESSVLNTVDPLWISIPLTIPQQIV